MAFLRAGYTSARPVVSLAGCLRSSPGLQPRFCGFRFLQTRLRHSGYDPATQPNTRLNNAPTSQNGSRVLEARKVIPDEVHFAPNEGEHGYKEEEAILYNHGYTNEKIRYLRPAIWAISVSAGIYAFSAYLEAREQCKPQPTFAAQVRQRMQARPSGMAPQDVATRWWQDQHTISKLSIGIIAANGAVHLGSFLAPGYWQNLWHTPIRNVNYTILTSTFVHSGPFHLFFNMWACYNFMVPTGYSRAFEGSPYHLGAFFLSAGILSGYAQHLSTIFSNTAKALQAGIMPTKYIPSGGASGALFGIFGVFCMEYPNAGVGIVFVPISIAAQYFLPAVMAFDLYGMTFGFRSLSLGHAAHLSGALIGAGYSYFDGKDKIWKPLVQFFKKRIQNQNS